MGSFLIFFFKKKIRFSLGLCVALIEVKLFGWWWNFSLVEKKGKLMIIIPIWVVFFCFFMCSCWSNAFAYDDWCVSLVEAKLMMW